MGGGVRQVSESSEETCGVVHEHNAIADTVESGYIQKYVEDNSVKTGYFW